MTNYRIVVEKHVDIEDENDVDVSVVYEQTVEEVNLKDIIMLCNLLRLDKNFKGILPKKINLPDFKGIMSNSSKKISPSIEKKMTKFILKGFFESSFRVCGPSLYRVFAL